MEQTRATPTQRSKRIDLNQLTTRIFLHDDVECETMFDQKVSDLYVYLNVHVAFHFFEERVRASHVAVFGKVKQ
jgi:hypothetical protein